MSWEGVKKDRDEERRESLVRLGLSSREERTTKDGANAVENTGKYLLSTFFSVVLITCNFLYLWFVTHLAREIESEVIAINFSEVVSFSYWFCLKSNNMWNSHF